MTYVHGNSAMRLNILYAKAKKERCRERERKREKYLSSVVIQRVVKIVFKAKTAIIDKTRTL